jgi:exopolyphosphatase / guanosine-5'-triphosphate,3'-diphosphate pyrophosphatase
MASGQRIAVVDMGTNSTRLLVVDVAEDGRLEEVERQTHVTRLGDGVDASGRLAGDAMERAHDRLGEYAEMARKLEATKTVAVATSAVRDSENGEEFAADVRERHGFEMRVITGDEEARLTFLGATSGRDPAGGATLVIDIGGGSTEYVVGTPGSGPDFHVSTRLGSVRQTERHLTADPPGGDELHALSVAAQRIVEEGVPAEIREAVEKGIAVAGTATSLAAIDQELEPYDPEMVHGYELVLGECERILARLAAVPLEERRETPGLHPDRAPTILAGAVILIESMRAFSLEAVEISEADILHGVALEAVVQGSQRG